MTSQKAEYKEVVEQYEENGEFLETKRGWAVLGETPRGKKIFLVPDGVYGLYEIKFENGGVVPKELRGKYTSQREAQETATWYINAKYVRPEDDKRMKVNKEKFTQVEEIKEEE